MKDRWHSSWFQSPSIYIKRYVRLCVCHILFVPLCVWGVGGTNTVHRMFVPSSPHTWGLNNYVRGNAIAEWVVTIRYRAKGKNTTTCVVVISMCMRRFFCHNVQFPHHHDHSVKSWNYLFLYLAKSTNYNLVRHWHERSQVSKKRGQEITLTAGDNSNWQHSRYRKLYASHIG